jgi:hypothetical protein
MTSTPSDAAEHGGNLPFDKRQLKRLFADHIAPAFKAMKARGALPANEDYEGWRREETFKAVGLESLRACGQRHYAPLCAHFQRLKGNHQAADNWLVKAANNQAAMGRAKLRQTIAETRDTLGDSLAYCRRICRAKFKTTDLEALTDKQAWTLVFDLRRAAQKKRGKK